MANDLFSGINCVKDYTSHKLIDSMFHLQLFDLMFVMAEPTASGVFCNRMLSMVNAEDVNAIIQAQRHM